MANWYKVLLTQLSPGMAQLFTWEEVLSRVSWLTNKLWNRQNDPRLRTEASIGFASVLRCVPANPKGLSHDKAEN